MSAYLGPIHFWLYNKILFQEDLLDAIAAYAVNNNWLTADEAATYTAADHLQIAVNFKMLLMNQIFTAGYKAAFMTAKVVTQPL